MTSAKPRPPLIPGETRAYPVLPLRDIVVFPHMIAPLFVGRKKSIGALEEAMRSDTFIMLATQKNASDDDPATEAIYEIGTLASVLQLLKLPDGTVKVLVEGAQRAKAVKYTDRSEYYEAEAVALGDTMGECVEAKAFARSVTTEFESYVKLNKRVPPEAVGVVQQIEDYAKLADTVASHLALKIPERQAILETTARQSFWPWIARYEARGVCRQIYARVGRGAVAVFDVEDNNALHQILNEWADIVMSGRISSLHISILIR
jgi:ATP-dependent Lon protease